VPVHQPHDVARSVLNGHRAVKLGHRRCLHPRELHHVPSQRLTAVDQAVAEMHCSRAVTLSELVSVTARDVSDEVSKRRVNGLLVQQRSALTR
jgi:hypothetical protein